MMQEATPTLSVIGAGSIDRVLKRDYGHIKNIVRDAYVAFGDGKANNPHSSFLTFEDMDPLSRNRIIALPAYIREKTSVAGLKWIASFPGNHARNMARASAVLLLNDMQTGFPFACMEGSLISASRTAASAVLGAELLLEGKRSAHRIGYVGAGLIASTIMDFFSALDWEFSGVRVYDTDLTKAAKMKDKAELQHGVAAEVSASAENLTRDCDLIVLATTASTPYLLDPATFSHAPRVLNISLRDLGPDVVLSSDNIVDDTDHCLRANTSPHLAEVQSGSRAFVNGNIYDCLPGGQGSWRPDPARTAIFSPFGMGILDLAVGLHVYQESLKEGDNMVAPGFFP
jgi:N-[(2S)-2-amino-2-carboxyethyl]-L-glutamate dehydrogenase